MTALPLVKALLFDVFGTLVDWRTSIATDLRAFGDERGIACDWYAFVDAWRGAYVPSMDRVRRGTLPWQNLDALHAASFDELATRFALPPVSFEDRTWIVRRWHELAPWPEVPSAMARLHASYVTGSLSNGNVGLLVDLARFARLRFDTVFSAELFRHYKPDPDVYLGAVALLGCEPGNVMLVAAHNADLRAAQALGLRAAFVARPTEYGPSQEKDLAPDGDYDVAVRDLTELADRLGAGA
ncbi:MAG: haloacid dehalogenase type II [Vulcanimicrobiaceae bacterium]